MKLLLRSVQYALICVLLLFALLPARADAPQWVEVRSPHFSVITDAGEKRGREVAVRFEQMRSVFGTLIDKAKVNLAVPLQIVAFRSTKEMRQFAPLWHGKPTQLGGLFQPGEDRSFIMLDMSLEDPWKAVFHEYAHQLLNGNSRQFHDPWFEEGFAEYFSTIEVDDKEARLGKPSESALLILQQNGMMKIADLFKIRHNSATYNESGDRRTVFYAESNMLVHYLYDNRIVSKAAVYFDLENNKHVPVEQAIQQAFGMSATEFDKVLHNYISGNRYKYVRIPTPSDLVTTGYTVTPISTADSNAVLADAHLHSPDYQDKAITEFQDILKVDPNNAAACRGLGYGYLRKQQYDQAGTYFRRAAQLDSKDPRVHYYSALLLSREGSFTNRSDLPEIIKELETTISVDPNSAEPYMLLGFARARNGEPARGLEAMQKAVSLNPSSEIYQFNLAQLYLANQKLDEAIAYLHTLEGTQNPSLSARVQQSLAQAQRVQDLMKRGPVTLNVQESSEESKEESDDKPSASVSTSSPDQSEAVVVNQPAPPGKVTPIKFLQGTITAVDCSSLPAASITVASGAKTWKMNVADTSHMLLFGADKFSCSWNKQKAGINYSESGDAQGNVVSIEIQ